MLALAVHVQCAHSQLLHGVSKIVKAFCSSVILQLFCHKTSFCSRVEIKFFKALGIYILCLRFTSSFLILKLVRGIFPSVFICFGETEGLCDSNC